MGCGTHNSHRQIKSNSLICSRARQATAADTAVLPVPTSRAPGKQVLEECRQL